MNKFALFVFVLVLIGSVAADCEKGQININFASASKLEKLDGVGEKIAEYIIDARPFDDIDELIDVERIGEKTLEKIKKQGLACVGDEDDEEEEEEIIGEKIAEEIYEEKIKEVIEEVEEPKIISLNAKVVEIEENEKSNFAIYGFVGFCILLGILFLVQKKGNEKEVLD